MSAPKHIGTFTLTSDELVISDPGYDKETTRVPGLGCYISHCQQGEWRVELIADTTPQHKWEMPRFLTAIHQNFSTPDDPRLWKRIEDRLGGDGGILGIYDVAHFHDDSLVPSNQQWTFDGKPAIAEDLWYSYNCEAIKGHLATIIPFGAVIGWDGGLDVDAFEQNGKIVAVRLSISGWPDRV